MKRHALAILAATLAGPYLVGFFLVVLFTLTDLAGGRPIHPADLFGFIVIGSFGLALFGIPLLILASVCAVLLHAFRSQALWTPVLTGAGIGACFLAVAFSSLNRSQDRMIVSASGALTGALCGWIYWRIALRGQTPKTRAIDAA